MLGLSKDKPKKILYFTRNKYMFQSHIQKFQKKYENVRRQKQKCINELSERV